MDVQGGAGIGYFAKERANGRSNHGDTTMPMEQNKAIVRRFLEALDQQDFDHIARAEQESDGGFARIRCALDRRFPRSPRQYALEF